MHRQPLDVENRYLLAGIYLNLGIGEQKQQPKRAIEAFHRALQLSVGAADPVPEVPDYPHRMASVHFLLGVQYEATGQLPRLQDELRQYLAISPRIGPAGTRVPDYRAGWVKVSTTSPACSMPANRMTRRTRYGARKNGAVGKSGARAAQTSECPP